MSVVSTLPLRSASPISFGHSSGSVVVVAAVADVAVELVVVLVMVELVEVVVGFVVVVLVVELVEVVVGFVVVVLEPVDTILAT